MTTIDAALKRIPYAVHLGLRSLADGRFEAGPDERFIGNPMLRAFHGGALFGLMECAMAAAAMAHYGLDAPPRLVNMTTSYLSSSTVDACVTIQVRLVKTGRRIAALEAEVFQRDRAVAAASSLFRAPSSSAP